MRNLLHNSPIKPQQHGILILFILFLAACAPVNSGISTTLPELQQHDPSLSPTTEMIPVEQITNLPTHSETATPPPQPAETSIQSSPEQDEQQPPTAPEPNLDSLFGAESTFGQADLLVKRPGQLSQLISPFRVIAFAEPGPDNLVKVRLLGEDGRTLSEKTVKVMDYLGLDNGNMITDLDFEISSLSELGRIEFSVTDEFGRLKAQNSVDVILLSVGETNRNFAPEIQEQVIIQYPPANFMVEGDSLLVSGLVRTTSDQPLTLTLTDESGHLIATERASVILSDQQEFGLFIGEISYQVDMPIWVRLSVIVPGERIPGVEFIKTMELVVSP